MTEGKRSRSQRSVGPPPDVRCISCPVQSISTKEAEVEQKPAERREPETKGIQAWKRHVSRANHQRDQIVCKAEQDGHHDEENHRCSMHGEHAVEDLWRNKIVVRAYQLDTDNGRFKPGDYEKEQGVQDVQNPQALVIDRGHPLMQRFNPWPTRGFRSLNGYRIRRHG